MSPIGGAGKLLHAPTNYTALLNAAPRVRRVSCHVPCARESDTIPRRCVSGYPSTSEWYRLTRARGGSCGACGPRESQSCHDRRNQVAGPKPRSSAAQCSATSSTWLFGGPRPVGVPHTAISVPPSAVMANWNADSGRRTRSSTAPSAVRTCRKPPPIST